MLIKWRRICYWGAVCTYIKMASILILECLGECDRNVFMLHYFIVIGELLAFLELPRIYKQKS